MTDHGADGSGAADSTAAFQRAVDAGKVQAKEAGTTTRHLRLTVTANTGWPAPQFSEVEACRS
ncbi:glycoside hydrolase family 55 protein [Streptomyces sp. NBC_01210]|uniref:hypothetical protein n=1 Tax=Streptomyces sp. NBC_01210 TaxID=2903774 RepID=UPI002E152D16|nr:glycoside hydrolase family 55 protein [Streptomyces sp. NBC_01210]